MRPCFHSVNKRKAFIEETKILEDDKIKQIWWYQQVKLDTINPIYPMVFKMRSTFSCSVLLIVMHRRDLLTNVVELVRLFGYIHLSNKDFLIYGGKNLTNELYRKIIEWKLRYIHTGRFDNYNFKYDTFNTTTILPHRCLVPLHIFSFFVSRFL